MKKELKKLLSFVLVMTLLGSNIAYANELSTGEWNTKKEDTEIQPRSRALASATSEITNEGEGVLGIYADFRSYEGVEWGQITIRLQRRKSLESGSWEPAKTYTFEFDGDDYSNGIITYAYTEFEARGFATNYYYRLTCTHKVKTSSGTYESKNTQTDGVLLTSYPVFRSADEEE